MAHFEVITNRGRIVTQAATKEEARVNVVQHYVRPGGLVHLIIYSISIVSEAVVAKENDELADMLSDLWQIGPFKR